MDNAPPPALIIQIDDAQYDAAQKTASIKMSKAFQKSGKISAYKGQTIKLIYKNEPESLNNCPDVRVPLQDIKRSIDFSSNTVTITIANIEQSLADKIAKTLCLYIDAETVKKVGNPNYRENKTDPKKPFSNLND